LENSFSQFFFSHFFQNSFLPSGKIISTPSVYHIQTFPIPSPHLPARPYQQTPPITTSTDHGQLGFFLALSAAAAAATIIILDYCHQDGSPYYGDGGKAKYVQFVLDTACPELFHEITGLERAKFDKLVHEFRDSKLLEDGRSVSVEEQVLIFLDIARYSNLMQQTAVKFCRGLYTTNR